jgi:hypothetical protein
MIEPKTQASPYVVVNHMGLGRPVERLTQTSEQNVAAAACKCDEGWIMALSLTELTGVVGPRRVYRAEPRRPTEHRALQLFSATPERELVADGSTGTPYDRR